MKDFLFTLLAWLFTLPVIAASIAFAIYNPDTVVITVNPFRDPVTLPVYVPVLAAVGFGFLFGALMTWAGTGALSKKNREQKKQIKLLEKQIAEAHQPKMTRHNYSLIPSAFVERH